MKRYDFVNGLFGGFWALALAWVLTLVGASVYLALHPPPPGYAIMFSLDFRSWGLSLRESNALCDALIAGIFVAGFWAGTKILKDQSQSSNK